MPRFVQLATADCTYLLQLIDEMDSQTLCTERQRSYTVPKLHQISKDGRSARLARKDIEYLLELIEDDDLEETLQQRLMTQSTLEEIISLQIQTHNEQVDREQQRAARRERRLSVHYPEQALAKHFEQATPVRGGGGGGGGE